MVRSDGNGSFVIKKIYGIVLFILLIVTTTISAVMTVGVRPVKDRVCEIEANDKIQDDKIHKLQTAKAVEDERYNNIMKALEKIEAKLYAK